jgi:nucleoside-diphosphate-sugar epimerase
MVTYKDRKVLVTGATGFVGGRLAECLAFEHGADVCALIRDWRHAVWLTRLPISFVVGDVTRPDSLKEAMLGREIVFHCVGVGGTREECWAINVEGTRNVLHAAATAGVKRVVYLSSGAVHGASPPKDADEDAPYTAGSIYAASKVAAEEVIASFTRDHSPSVVILRPLYIWGPRSEWYTVDPVRQIRKGTWQLIDEGRGDCHAVHVDNLVHSMLLAGQSNEAAGQAFLITDDEPITWREFFLGYAQMAGKNSIPSVSSRRVTSYPIKKLDDFFESFLRFLTEHMPSVEPFRFLFRVVHFGTRAIRQIAGSETIFAEWDLLKYSRSGGLNTAKARNVLGYRPIISINEGMKQTKQWLQSQGFI